MASRRKQSTGVRDAQEHAAAIVLDGVEEPAHLFGRGNHRQRLLAAHVRQPRDELFTFEHLSIEEAQATHGDVVAAPRALADVSEVQLPLMNLGGTKLIGRAAEVSCKMSDGSHVGLLRSDRVVLQTELLDQPLA